VAIGDLNKDGKTDLVVANSGSNTVSVMLGNGHGIFRPKRDFAVGTGDVPVSIAAGDLNGDGMPDVAVACRGSSTVAVLLGNGIGGLGGATNYGTGRPPVSVVIVDLNGDSKPDLVVAGAVLLGNGDGTFRNASPSAAQFNTAAECDYGWGPYCLPGATASAIGDLNGDGKADLVVTNAYASGFDLGDENLGYVYIALGHGDGTFGGIASYDTGLRASSVAIGDLDGDGKPDLAVSNAEPNTVSVLPGNGDGTFGPKVDFGTGFAPASVAIGDLNGDGKPDLVTANTGNNTVSVLLNLRRGKLTATHRDGATMTFGAFAAAAGPDAEEFALSSVGPNPSPGDVRIGFSVPRPGRVRLRVLDVQGRVVAVLADGEYPAGRAQVTWDGTSKRGRVSAGLYFVRYEAGGRSAVKRVVLAP